MSDDELIEIILKHCECRPLDIYRDGYGRHSHDCDTDITRLAGMALRTNPYRYPHLREKHEKALAEMLRPAPTPQKGCGHSQICRTNGACENCDGYPNPP